MRHASQLDCIDWFCGMGGSSSGLVEAGIEIKVAANHWPRAIETHAANHPDTDHLCADIQAIDLRRLPKTRLMWASPICTEVSPSGGRKRRTDDLFQQHGYVAQAGFERTRVTFWEVIRAMELFRHDVVMIENVVEAVTSWELFPTWLHGVKALGYTPHFVSVSAAHVWDEHNPPAPQWRDRIYIVLTRKGIKAPDLEPRPLAWCGQCGENVPALQWWKPHGIPTGYRVGKYNQQYHYVCPEGHGRVEPWVAPAAAAIDWTDLGTRIGDRKRPLAEKTMERIRYGAQLVQSGGFGFSMAHGGRAQPIDLVADPMRTWTTGDTEAMAIAPWVMGGAGEQLPRPVSDPMRTQRASGADFLVAAAGNTWDAISAGRGSYVRAWPADGDAMQAQTTTGQLGVVTPPKDAYITMLRSNGRARPVTEALPTLTTGRNHMLVIPFRKGDRPHHAAAEPITTTATRSQHGVMVGSAELDVSDYHFRMLKPREAANAQRFDRGYVIHGNQGEQQMQAGNAVAVNVAHWIGKRVLEVLGGDAA